MPSGFFRSSSLSRPVQSGDVIPHCGACGLYKSCNSPRMAPTGRGQKGILVVAEAPGREEDEQGVQLVGKVGREFRKRLKAIGVDLDRDCWKTNSVICRPVNNEAPSDLQIDSCRPNVLRAIKALKPRVVILLGAASVKSLIGKLWRNNEDPGPIGRWVGWRIPCQSLNTWICPNWHPSYLLRQRDPALDLWFDRYLEAAVELDDVPWPDAPPDHVNKVECLFSADGAAGVLRQMIERGGMVAFDYETDRLKPDHPDARIVSCSVCWERERTIAFPWHGEARVAMGELLKSDLMKIGWNIKFETRWTRREFGHGVHRWIHDGMVAAHVLDNRRGITSAKFQAFVQLGLSPYDGEVSSYLEGEGGNGPNTIHRLDLKDLLTYNGIDSLVEYDIGVKQMMELGTWQR